MVILDLILLLFIAGFAFMGLRSGLIRESATLLGMVVGLLVAGRYYEKVSPMFLSLAKTTGMSNLVAFAVLLGLTWVAVLVLGALLRDILSSIHLGWLDHLGGMVLGLVKGLFIAEVIVLIVAAVPGQGMQSVVKGSFLGSRLASFGPQLLGLIPPLLRYWKPQ